MDGYANTAETQSNKSKSCALRVQLNNIDSYQCSPTPLDCRRTLIKGAADKLFSAPVIRIYGRTDEGKTALVHVHGIFPYVYIKYDGNVEEADAYIERLYHSINRAFCSSLGRDPNDPKNVFVAGIVLCKGVPFFGYHVGWTLFLKIHLINPGHLTKFADMLRNSAVLGAMLQPHEAHIPYVMQFFGDYNLYGCGFIDLSDVRYRQREPANGALARVSHCEIEVDVTAEMIMNRSDISQHMIHASFSSTRPDSNQVTSLKELWKEDSLRRTRLGAQSFKPPRSTQRNTEGTTWYREREFLERLNNTIAEDSRNSFPSTFDQYDSIPTAFETVELVSKWTKFEEVREPLYEGSESSGHADIISEDDGMDEIDDIPPPPEQMLPPGDETPGLESLVSLKRQNSNSFYTTYSAKRHNSTTRSFLNVSSSSRAIGLSSQSKSSKGSDQYTLGTLIKRFEVHGKVIGFRSMPPSRRAVKDTIEKFGPQVIDEDPFYGNDEDVPTVALVYAGTERRLRGSSVNYLKDFWIPPPPREPQGTTGDINKTYEYLPRIPPRSEVLATASATSAVSWADRVNIRNEATRLKSVGTKQARPQYMRVLVVEVLAISNLDKLPDPERDQVKCVFWRVLNDETFIDDQKISPCGIIAIGDEEFLLRLDNISPWPIVKKSNEREMFITLTNLMRYYDPDILSGYEMQNGSWGYLIDRAKRYDIDLLGRLSRLIVPETSGRQGDQWGLRHTTDISVPGRHMLNIWRVVRSEMSLTQYTLENVVYHSFKERIPHYDHTVLTKWLKESASHLSSLVEYFTSRVNYELRIIEKQELVGKYSEQARVIGIDYKSVLNRGSQYQVESFLSRLVRSENFIMVSPSKKQVGEQNALEVIPLVMEPESRFYTSPVLVLDFQSLYPSIVVAYNYCYSTLLGRVVPWRGRNKTGFTDLDLPPGLLNHLKDDVRIAPNGMVYVKESRRKSLLATMLTELLETRVMIKQGMKDFHQDDPAFQKSMNNRQLALKLIANVTYGYTSASYSGRMPCSEIADSIVLSGRETLERAISTIQTNEKWGADVVYGDTDSIFVHLAGRTREEAFRIGEDIAATITKQNPSPVKLKFEKVYHPCILQTKKRYVGYMYESLSQKHPVFDAKGTETVRRDGTPIEQKLEENALRLIFETKDLSKVKSYLVSEWSKIISGDVTIKDFCFAKEVKLGTYVSTGNSLPPGAMISAKKTAQDKRAEPQYRERVPYVVVAGPPNSRLIERCVPPEELVRNPSLHLDARYYITKNLIPPLERFFNMMGANVRAWYDDMPKPTMNTAGSGLSSLVRSASCIMCGERSSAENDGICRECRKNPGALYTLLMRRRKLEQTMRDQEIVCRACSNLAMGDKVECTSGDCQLFYSRVRSGALLDQLLTVEW